MSRILDVYNLIERIANLLSCDVRQHAFAEGLHERQIAFLKYLQICNRYSNSPQAMSEYFSLTKGAVSQTLNALEEKKLISKSCDKTDTRRIHLSLSSQGKKFLAKWDKNFPEISAPMSEQNSLDLVQLKSLLEQFLLSLQRQNNNATFGVCHTCKHFERHAIGTEHRCGLTKEPLSQLDAEKICREHTAL